MQRARTVGLLLAAGAGTRFDPVHAGRKLDVHIDGVSVAERSFIALSDAVDAVVVATRDDQSQIAQIARERGAHVIVPADAAMGMGHSLAAAALVAQQLFPALEQVVVMLADMPWVRTGTIRLLLDEAATGDCIVQPRCKGQRGHPVAFPARYVSALAACSGDIGARDVMRDNMAAVRWVDVDDAGVLRDVDAPGDLSGPSPE